MSAAKPPGPPSDLVHSEAFLASLMSRQLKLSVTCALAFVSMLAALPLLNRFVPEWMGSVLPGGFTLSWFLLGIAFFPVVWLISSIFIRRSIALEQDEIARARSSAGPQRSEAGSR